MSKDRWIYLPALAHECDFPSTLDERCGVAIGAIWKCGKCGKQYQIIGMRKWQQLAVDGVEKRIPASIETQIKEVGWKWPWRKK